MQWLTPAIGGKADENKLADIFAEAIRYQLLPRDVFFQLKDFQIFAEMGIETSQLPVEDVEACIRQIQLEGTQLDPAKPADREKIGQIVQRYFADPGTKYRRTLDELSKRSQEISELLTREKQLRGEAERRADELKAQQQELAQQLSNMSRDREAANARIADLEVAMQASEERQGRRRLIASAVGRLLISLAILIAVEGSVALLVFEYGDGNNFLQKAVKASWAFVVGFGAVAALFPYIMGRERMKVLKWWRGQHDAQ